MEAMKKMLLSVIIVFVAWSLMDLIIHGLILGSSYAETAQLWRPEAEMKVVLMRVVTIIAAFAFCAIYSWLIRDKGIGSGLKYGFWFGIVMGVSMGYGSYSVMPIPYHMALTWFLGRLAEGIIAGIIVGAIDKE
jgi:hypothetical protein